MTRAVRIGAAVMASTSLPALAHVTGASTPHWHASDAWGLLAVALLTGLAAWLDRRGR